MDQVNQNFLHCQAALIHFCVNIEEAFSSYFQFQIKKIVFHFKKYFKNFFSSASESFSNNFLTQHEQLSIVYVHQRAEFFVLYSFYICSLKASTSTGFAGSLITFESFSCLLRRFSFIEKYFSISRKIESNSWSEMKLACEHPPPPLKKIGKRERVSLPDFFEGRGRMFTG